VKDGAGNTIKDGVTASESVAQVGEGSRSVVVNPNAMAPFANGVFPDIVGIGETSTTPFDRNNPEHIKHAANVIETALSKPTTDARQQTLTIRGCGVTLTVVNERTQSNVGPDGKIRDYKGTGRLRNNYIVSRRCQDR
jgi:hypothetical protein